MRRHARACLAGRVSVVKSVCVITASSVRTSFCDTSYLYVVPLATCPGLPVCSDHGSCAPGAIQCQCASGWRGSDCSIVTCPGLPACRSGLPACFVPGRVSHLSMNPDFTHLAAQCARDMPRGGRQQVRMQRKLGWSARSCRPYYHYDPAASLAGNDCSERTCRGIPICNNHGVCPPGETVCRSLNALAFMPFNDICALFA